MTTSTEWLLRPLTLVDFGFLLKLQNVTPLSAACTFFTAASPFALRYYSHEPVYVRWSSLLWTKVVSLFFFFLLRDLILTRLARSLQRLLLLFRFQAL